MTSSDISESTSSSSSQNQNSTTRMLVLFSIIVLAMLLTEMSSFHISTTTSTITEPKLSSSPSPSSRTAKTSRTHAPKKSSTPTSSDVHYATEEEIQNASQSIGPFLLPSRVRVEDALRVMQSSGLQVNDVSGSVSNSPIFDIYKIPNGEIKRTVLLPVSRGRVSSSSASSKESGQGREAVSAQNNNDNNNADTEFSLDDDGEKDLDKNSKRPKKDLLKKTTKTSKPLPKIIRPTESNRKVAVCFFGLVRYHGVVERIYERTQPNLQHFEHDIFVSTWNYFQSKKSLNKLHRRRNLSWFANGEQQDDMADRMKSIFGNKLKGVFVGDHKQVRFCKVVTCIVSMVRANCMLAIAAQEERSNSYYPFFFVVRIDRSIEYPVWFVGRCATETLLPPSKPYFSNYSFSTRNSATCHLRVSNCTSWFRGAFFPPFARIDENSFVTHTFMTKWSSLHQRLGFRDFTLISDYAAIGHRDAVASILVHLFKASEDSWSLAPWPELNVARSAKRASLQTYPVNFGYETEASMGRWIFVSSSSVLSKKKKTIFKKKTENKSEEDAEEANVGVYSRFLENETTSVAERKQALSTCGPGAPHHLYDSCFPENDRFYDSNGVGPFPHLVIVPNNRNVSRKGSSSSSASSIVAAGEWKLPYDRKWHAGPWHCCNTFMGCFGGKRK